MADYNAIERLWNATGDEEMNVYVHTPFCLCKCKYCLYTGKVGISDVEEKYFTMTLEKSLDRFKDMLSKRKVKTLYFGGGTPNAYSPETLKRVFNKAYSICQPECAILEINPAFMTEEQLKDIVTWGITLITFGVQSFDERVLRKQTRAFMDEEKIKKFVEICHEAGVKVSMDIMCYIDTYTNKDIKLFEKDMEKAMAMDADFITAYPEMNLIKKDPAIAEHFSKYIKDKAKTGYENYYVDISKKNDESYKIEHNPNLVYRAIKNEHDYDYFMDKILPYYENDFASAKHNIIGFGDKNCSQAVVSYSPEKFMYTEHFSFPEPTYDIKYISPELDV